MIHVLNFYVPLRLKCLSYLNWIYFFLIWYNISEAREFMTHCDFWNPIFIYLDDFQLFHYMSWGTLNWNHNLVRKSFDILDGVKEIFLKQGYLNKPKNHKNTTKNTAHLKHRYYLVQWRPLTSIWNESTKAS